MSLAVRGLEVTMVNESSTGRGYSTCNRCLLSRRCTSDIVLGREDTAVNKEGKQRKKSLHWL